MKPSAEIEMCRCKTGDQCSYTDLVGRQFMECGRVAAAFCDVLQYRVTSISLEFSNACNLKLFHRKRWRTDSRLSLLELGV